MGYFFAEELAGTRTRFQRFSDSALYYGWIEALQREMLSVTVPEETAVQAGDRFVFRAHTSQASLRFIADLLEISPSAAEGEKSLCFRVVSRVECQAPSEEARHRLCGQVIAIVVEGATIPGALVDASATGAAFLSEAMFEPGAVLTLTIEDPERSLTIKGEVKYSFPSKDGKELYRTGLKLVDCNRLVAAQWRGLLDAA